ncbi:MAG TPA: hypothetical protein VFW49_00415 [Fluviicoccus sp.]|nr:hypothetical protein [Fluviicoccus sp.]
MHGSDQATRLSGLWQGYASLWLSGVESRYPAVAFQSRLARAVAEAERLKTLGRETIRVWRRAGEALAAAADARAHLDSRVAGENVLPPSILLNRIQYLNAAMAAASAERRRVARDAAVLLDQLALLAQQVAQLRQQRLVVADLILDTVVMAGLDAQLAGLDELEDIPCDLAVIAATVAECCADDPVEAAESGRDCGPLSDSEVSLATRAMLYVSRVDGDSPQSLALIRQFFESGIETQGLPLFDDLRESLGDGVVMDAARFCSTGNRELILKNCLLTAYADGCCSVAEWRVLQQLADDLDIPASRLAQLDAEVRERLLQGLSGLPDTVSVAQVARGLQPPV